MASIFDPDFDPNQNPLELEAEAPARSKKKKFDTSLTKHDIAAGRRALKDMVATAFEALNEAMVSADYPTAIKAAQIILDRAGFGPKSTVDVNTTNVDLTELSRDELAARARQIAERLQARPQEPKVIDVKSVTVN